MVLDADNNVFRYNGPKMLKSLEIMLETQFILCFRSKFDEDSKCHTFKRSSISIYSQKCKKCVMTSFTQSVINIFSYFPNKFGIGPPKGGLWGPLSYTSNEQSATNSTEWGLSTS